MKKTSLLFAASSLGLGLLGLNDCGNSSSVATVANADVGEIVTLHFAYASNSQPAIDAMNEFKCLVEEETDGSVQIQYFPDEQLGGKRELIELTRSGAVDFTKVDTSVLESLSKNYSIFLVPYLSSDEEYFFKVMDNEEMMEPICRSTRDLEFTGLTYHDFGQRSFYMVDDPIHTPEDSGEKKTRVVQSGTIIRMVELLGGSSVPMGSDEVYTSLQFNLISGPENNESILYTAGYGDVAKYYSYDEHTRVPDITIMNDAIKEQLADEQEKVIGETAKKSTVFKIKASARAIEEEKALAQEEHGVQFNDVDDTPFREAVAPLHDTLKNDPTHKDLYQKIQEQGTRL